MRELTYIRAIQEALFEEMRRDEKVFLLGESVRGGNYEHTVGLVAEFGPDRVLDTPICETAISGAGIGSVPLRSPSLSSPSSRNWHRRRRVASGWKAALCSPSTQALRSETTVTDNALPFYLLEYPEIYGQLGAKEPYPCDCFSECDQTKGLPATMAGAQSRFGAQLQAQPVTKLRDLPRDDFELRQSFSLQLRLDGVFVPAAIRLPPVSPAHSGEDVESILHAHHTALEACV